jgi:GNAT superfamily N-acetyltransferase
MEGSATVPVRAGIQTEDRVRITKAGAERIDELEPLWRELHAHHREIAPVRAGLAARGSEEAWKLRVPKYQSLLSDPRAFVLLAEEHGQLLGYALVHLTEGPPGYVSGALIGEVETLAVCAEARGKGVGTALMDAVERELDAMGIREIRLGVVAGNDDAMRFYERRGMAPFAHVLLAKVRR